MKYINPKKFPYKTPRKVQKSVLQIMDSKWDDYKYYICELPTGTGKSAIAKTVCSSFKNGFIITATKQLQDQYYDEFKSRDLISIKGKANYPCNLNTKLNCEIGYCVVDKKLLSECKRYRTCKYYSLRDDAMKANIVLTSYQYFLRSIECTQNWKPRDIVIFDECHLLEQQLVQWASIKIDLNMLIEKYNIVESCEMTDYCRISVLPTESGYKKNKQWISTILKLIFNRRNEMFEDIKNTLNLSSLNPDELCNDEYDVILETHKDYYELDKFYKKLQVFMKIKSNNDWLVEPCENGLELTPIDVSEIFSYYIKCMGIKKIIFMSASIIDMAGFRKTFGLPKEETLLIRSDSEFNPKNSPIVYNPVCKMNYESINNNLDKITDEIKKIMDIHKNEKGIIHSGNLNVSKYIMEHINSDRLLIRYDDVSNQDIIKKHISSNKPTILVSPSLSEGVDLKGDLSKFQIIVKLPFSNLSDKRVSAKIKTDNDWYISKMFSSFIQQCGRSTRNEKDKSVTYVLDQSFTWWVLKYRPKGWFQKQFIDRIVWKKENFKYNEFNEII